MLNVPIQLQYPLKGGGFMKIRVLFVCFAVALALCAGGMAFAATTVNVAVKAVVPSSLALTSSIRSAAPGQDPFGPGSADATTIDFGTLTFDTTNNIWVASKYFAVFLIATTSGRPYVIQQTNSGIASGASNLNANMLMTPDYQSADKLGTTAQGLIPAGDSVGPATLSFGTNKHIYDSTSGLSRIVRAYYGLATGAPGEPTGSAPITTNKLSGTYSGSITFSVVLK